MDRAETDMKIPSTEQKKIISEGHSWILTEITIDLENQTMTLNVIDVTILDT